MKDFRDNISRHSNFDDQHYWSFPRVHIPRLHREEFDKGWTIDRIVFFVCVVLLLLGLLAVNLKGAV